MRGRIASIMKRCVVLLAVGLWLALSSPAQAGGNRGQWLSNLKNIWYAIESYHDVFRRYPSDIVDPQGKPLLSWRVAILPFVEQDSLYKEFHLNEPWDSPHNFEVAKRLAWPFVNPMREKQELAYFTFAKGNGTCLGAGPRWTRAGITCDPYRTIAIIELNEENAVFWSKPDVWTYDAENPLVGLAKNPRGRQGFLDVGAYVIFRNGKIGFLTEDAEPDQVRALFSGTGYQPDSLTRSWGDLLFRSLASPLILQVLWFTVFVITWAIWIIARLRRGRSVTPGEYLILLLAPQLAMYVLCFLLVFESPGSGLLGNSYGAHASLWLLPRIAGLFTCLVVIVCNFRRLHWRLPFAMAPVILFVGMLSSLNPPPQLDDSESLVTGISQAVPVASLAMMVLSLLGMPPLTVTERLRHLAAMIVCLVPFLWCVGCVTIGHFQLTNWLEHIRE